MTQNTENRIIEDLTPKAEYKASPDLKSRILAEAAKEASRNAGRNNAGLHRTWRLAATGIAAAAAILIGFFILIPTTSPQARAAGKYLKKAAGIFGRTPYFTMVIDTRTKPHENFSFIDPRLEFVEHHLYVDNGHGMWRLEKPQRIALNDGKNIWLWCPATGTGSKMKTTDNVLEDFAEFLDPAGLLNREKERALKNREASYSETIDANTIRLTANFPAEGDFENDYMLYSSVAESPTRREYIFDRESGRLLGMKIEAVSGDLSVTIMELREIDYGAKAPAETYACPDNIEWNDLTKITVTGRFTGITAEEAVKKMFTAMETWDEDILREICPYSNLKQIEKYYRGCRLTDMKGHFISGEYAGVFVPCSIQYPDGRTEELYIAIRNDNEDGTWFVDGGL